MSDDRLTSAVADAVRRRRCRGRRDLRHDAARRRPVRGHLAHRRRQAAHRRAARLARRALHRGRLPAGQPEGRRVLPPGRHRAAASRRPTLVAFGSTRRPSGKVDDDPTLRRARRAPARPTACIVGKSGTSTSPRRCAPPSTRAWPWWATRCEFLRRRGPAGVLRRRALLRRLQGQPRVRAAGARGRGRPTAPRCSCCATPTAARCPTRSSAIVGEVVTPTSAATADRHPHPERHRLRGGQLGRRRASPAPPRCRARSTATASAPATPTS